MTAIVAWTQWPDLIAPDGITLLNPDNHPLTTSDNSEITFYVPTYMSGATGLSHLASMTALQYLQMPNAGYDDALAHLRPGLTLCNATGVHDDSTAELAVGLAIAARRGIPDFVRDQDRATWNHKRYPSFSDSKIAIVGYGSIGQNVARNLSGFTVEVTGFSRSGRDGALTMDQLDGLLPTFDIVILVLPLNAESKHLFDARRLTLLKDGALIVNVARGGIIDTDALVAELNSGRIQAALDVTDPEPLPSDHPLWRAKNVLIAPHVGGDSTAFESRGKKLVEDQIARLAQGAELKNIVAVGKA